MSRNICNKKTAHVKLSLSTHLYGVDDDDDGDDDDSIMYSR